FLVAGLILIRQDLRLWPALPAQLVLLLFPVSKRQQRVEIPDYERKSRALLADPVKVSLLLDLIAGFISRDQSVQIAELLPGQERLEPARGRDPVLQPRTPGLWGRHTA